MNWERKSKAYQNKHALHSLASLRHVSFECTSSLSHYADTAAFSARSPAVGAAVVCYVLLSRFAQLNSAPLSRPCSHVAAGGLGAEMW